MIFAHRSGVQRTKSSVDLQEIGPVALSTLYDDRAADEVLEVLLGSARATPAQQLALKQQFRRYCVLSDALQAPELSGFEDAAFTQRLMLRLRNESTTQKAAIKIRSDVFAPKLLATIRLKLNAFVPNRFSQSRLASHWPGVAVAACIVVVSWMVLPEVNPYLYPANVENPQKVALVQGTSTTRLTLVPAASGSASIPKHAVQAASPLARLSSDDMLSAYLTAHRPSLAVAMQDRVDSDLQTASLNLPDSRSEFLRGN